MVAQKILGWCHVLPETFWCATKEILRYILSALGPWKLETNFCLLKVAMKLLVRGIFSFVPHWMSRSLNKEIGNGAHFLHKYLCNEIYAHSRQE